MDPTKILNCLGQKCPEPLYQTRYALEYIESGEILKVITDDPASEGDIRTLIKRRGHELINFEWDKEKVVFWIKTN